MLKKCVLFLVALPVPAWAVEGATIFNGPDVPIVESVARDFPRYDLGELCRLAMPGTDLSAEAAQATCKVEQGRLAGIASQNWNMLSPVARLDCLRRADKANGKRYAVLYSCVKAASFRVYHRDSMNRIAERIARQNGRVPVDSQAVGSIK